MPARVILIYVGIGAAVVAALYLAGRFGLPAVGQAVNPLNRENIFNQGAGGVVSVLTGRPETLGGLFAEWFDPSTRAVEEMLRVR